MAKLEKSQLNDDDKKLTNEQSFDSALGAMVSKLKSYVIPLVNEAFGEQFTTKAEVVLRNNKHVFQRIDSSLARRDSDSVVELTENLDQLIQKVYLFECETWFDKTIVLRIAEYGSAIAIENAEYTKEGVILHYPNSAVIVLRHKREIPHKMKITHQGPEGQEMSYFVPTLKIKDYTVDDIFKKRLLILLPFYLFRFANELDEMEENAEKRKEIETSLNEINQRLDDLAASEEINAYQQMTIQSLLMRVSDRLTARFVNVKKEVDDIMSGAIARTQADDILEQGQMIGEDDTMKLVSFLLANGKTEEFEKAQTDKAFFRKLITKFRNGELAVSGAET